MANIDNPHGFAPIGHLFGVDPEVAEFNKVVGYGTAIFINDSVHRVADGSIEATATNFTPGTTNVSGVALNYGALSTATTHLVIVDPFEVYEAQDNNDTDGFTAADLGLNVNLEANAGSTTTKQSGHELDESTAAVTATLDLHLMKLLAIANNAHGAWGRYEVTFNKHRYHSGSAGI
jgi:hypothetical protein